MRKFNEWHPNGDMVADGAISMTKVKNLLRKSGIYYATNIRNIRVNGQLRGCSGFVHSRLGNGVKDDGSERVVYFNTEYITSLGRHDDRLLVRVARDDRDYTGGRNDYCTFETFLGKLNEMFGDIRPALG